MVPLVQRVRRFAQSTRSNRSFRERLVILRMGFPNVRTRGVCWADQMRGILKDPTETHKSCCLQVSIFTD